MRYASDSRDFFAEAELLRNIAYAVGASIDEAREPENAQDLVVTQSILFYVRGFGPHVSFRIKAGFIRGK
jgi:hypothetical protein